MDEAYTYQLVRMSEIQDEIRKLKNISGMLDVSDKNIALLSSYFEQVVELFDTWHFDVKDDAYSVWGYLNGRKYTAYPTIERLVNMLANHIENFGGFSGFKLKPIYEPKETPRVEPSIMEMLDKVFGGSR